MSHFTVLVITQTAEQVPAALQSFHEFECTGTDDQYVQEVDMLAEARQDYETSTTTLYQRPDGTLLYPFDTEGNYCAELKPYHNQASRQLKLPGGWSETRGPTKDHQSLAEYASEYYGIPIVRPGEVLDPADKHKYGYCTVDAEGNILKLIRRTNPNKKWDWYQIGGRWSGLLRLKPGARGAHGERSLLDRSGKPSDPQFVDQCRKGDLDIVQMRAAAVAEAQARWEKAETACPELGPDAWKSWEEIRKNHDGDIEGARDAYHAQAAMTAVREAFGGPFFFNADQFLTTREQYLASSELGALGVFAVLKDGQWAERGEMGWFGCVMNEKDPDAWSRELNKLVDELPDDALLTVVDCHI